MEIFGFSFFERKAEQESRENLKSIAKDENDGSSTIVLNDNSGVDAIGGAYGYTTTFDIDPSITSEAALITKYREISLISEIEKAIDNIIDEFAATDKTEVVTLDLDDLEVSEKLKKQITDEFNYVLNLLDFNDNAFDIIKRWYVDGRLQYQVVIDKDNFAQEGIGKLTYLDPRKLKKVRVFKKDNDRRTNVEVFQNEKPFYLYNQIGFMDEYATQGYTSHITPEGVKLSEEAVVQVTSGLLNPTNTVVLSYLHKAIRPLNQLKSLEDATVIYKLTRAPERRIFYIDVGNLPAAKAEQVLKRQMQQYKSKVVYDTASGTIRSDPKHMTMIEDYWLPRRGDGKSTEITTLKGDTNMGDMDEVTYFLNKLYNSLNVPITRMDPSAGFSIGRSTEITRDEVKFMKFIARLRKQFSSIFRDLLKRQLALKNIMHPEEFERIKHLISFEYKSDNHFDEMLDNEVWEGRLGLIERMGNYRGQYISQDWLWRNVFHFSDEDIEQQKKLIQEEIKEGLYPNPTAMDGGMDSNVSHVVHSADNSPKIEQDAPKQTETINNSNESNTNREQNSVESQRND